MTRHDADIPDRPSDALVMDTPLADQDLATAAGKGTPPETIGPRKQGEDDWAYVCAVECGAKCCRHVAWTVEEPTTQEEYDEWYWAVLHEGISFFKEDDEWYMLIATTCSKLGADNLCGIYETRPQTCRDYSPDACEHPDGLDWEEYIDSKDALDEYWARMFAPRRRGQKRKTERQPPLPKMSAANCGPAIRASSCEAGPREIGVLDIPAQVPIDRESEPRN